MKKIFTFLAAVLVTASLWAQSPEKMSYQAVIRNADNNLVANTVVGMQISILQTSADGVTVYTETQTPTTNANGLVSLEIGTGDSSDDFSTIDWANGLYFIKTETDPSGGTNYTITGVSQLLSVPYALHAKTAETITGTFAVTETDPTYTASQAVNITVGDITNLSNLSGVNTGDQDLSGLATTTAVNTYLALKVDKVSGKGLSTNNYTNADKMKVRKLSGTNTGDQDLSTLATKIALGDSTALVRSEIPDVSGFLTSETQNLDDVLTQNNSAGNKNITNLADPANAQDAATKAYIDNLLIKIGVTAKLLANGFSLQQLIDGGHTASELVSGGASLTDLVSAGFSESEFIGSSYQGGIIAYISQIGDPGYVAGEIHGLIAAASDQSADAQWFFMDRLMDGAHGDGLYVGKTNTAFIVAELERENLSGYAATICDNYSVAVDGIDYDDWYLPSEYELGLLYTQKDVIGGFAIGSSESSSYWSSTASRVQEPFIVIIVDFNDGETFAGMAEQKYRVRAVRAF